MSELSDYLKANLPDGWSGRQVAREARKLGHDVSDAGVAVYLSGKHGVPTDAMIAALAETLRLDETEMRRAANLRTPFMPWDPPSLSRYLREDQRAALETLIATMVNREEGEEHADGSTAIDGPLPDEGGGVMIEFPTPAETPEDDDVRGYAVASGDEGDLELAKEASRLAAAARAEQEDAMREMDKRLAEKQRQREQDDGDKT